MAKKIDKVLEQIAQETPAVAEALNQIQHPNPFSGYTMPNRIESFDDVVVATISVVSHLSPPKRQEWLTQTKLSIPVDAISPVEITEELQKLWGATELDRSPAAILRLRDPLKKAMVLAAPAASSGINRPINSEEAKRLLMIADEAVVKLPLVPRARARLAQAGNALFNEMRAARSQEAAAF